MHEMNRFPMIKEFVYEEQSIKNQLERNDLHDFFTQSYRGNLYKRKSGSVSRFYSSG